MKPFIIAAIAAAVIAPATQAQAKTHRPSPKAFEWITKRCLYIAVTHAPEKVTESDITRATLLCVNGAEQTIEHTTDAEAYQRDALTVDVEQATDQETADHAQLFLDAYDAGRVIGRGYAEPIGDDESYDPEGAY